uniref:Uncharacterized protein n=1 Tax=Rhizophora mucronata TaxID=61149 RepID=A0A2P2NDE0_RHIMU
MYGDFVCARITITKSYVNSFEQSIPELTQ